MPLSLKNSRTVLPSDSRFQLGGTLFLVSLVVFFLASILLYGIYANTRIDDPQSDATLPSAFLISTVSLIVISLLVHGATRAIRRERRKTTCLLLVISAIAALLFMAVQYFALIQMLQGPAMDGGTGKGVAGMVAVLAILHALHVAGGVVALGIVSIRSLLGKYDHERHWPVDFCAQYWHFLDLVWLFMLAAFWLTTGGFGF